jgi:hypothetical protein
MRVYFNLLHLINMLNTDLTCMLSLRPSGVYKTQSFVCIYIYISLKKTNDSLMVPTPILYNRETPRPKNDSLTIFWWYQFAHVNKQDCLRVLLALKGR